MESFGKLAEPIDMHSWGGILLCVGADLDYICNVGGLPHYNATVNMCVCCLANTTDAPHNNFHQDAAWRRTVVDNNAFLARIRRPMHDLARHEVFNRYTYRLTSCTCATTTASQAM